MGCGASKASADTAVTTSEKPTQMKEVKKDNTNETGQQKERQALPGINSASKSEPTVSSEKKKAAAFEISLDELRGSGKKKSLPKVEVSEESLKKLQKSGDRWKEIEEEEEERKKQLRNKRAAARPTTSSGPRLADDPEAARARLEEKVAQAEANRQRDLEELQAKQKKRQERAQQVLERKRQLQEQGVTDPEVLAALDKESESKLEWGGEKTSSDKI